MLCAAAHIGSLRFLWIAEPFAQFVFVTASILQLGGVTTKSHLSFVGCSVGFKRQESRMKTPVVVCIVLFSLVAVAHGQNGTDVSDRTQYKVLATSKTSSMQKEMQEAAEAGFKFAGVMGGETAFGGSEVLIIMSKAPGDRSYEYRLLATSKTATAQKELQEAGDAGYEYRGQTVFKSAFGGKEVIASLERDPAHTATQRFEYRLIATSKTGTMQKELSEAGDHGFRFVGVTVASTLMGGSEVVSILRRRVDGPR
jgi:hypothetical protein